MNNDKTILSALKTQLETAKQNASDHELSVYEPAVGELNAQIAQWLSENVCDSIHSVELHGETLTIEPNDSREYGNQITITYRGAWNRDSAFFESSSYRPDLKSNEDNTHAVNYYRVMWSVAYEFERICGMLRSLWMNVYNELAKAKDAFYTEIYSIERAIHETESRISEAEKEAYNRVGFECTIKPYVDYGSTKVDGETVYVKKRSDYSIRAQIGRSRWEYYVIHHFKVISFPKAKHGKVVLQYKCSSEDQTLRQGELSKQRYADFVSEVHSWQTYKAQEREEWIDERLISWNEKTTA